MIQCSYKYWCPFIYNILDYEHCCIYLAAYTYWFMWQSPVHVENIHRFKQKFEKGIRTWWTRTWMVTQKTFWHSAQNMLDSAMECCKQCIYISSSQPVNVVLKLAYLCKVNKHSTVFIIMNVVAFCYCACLPKWHGFLIEYWFITSLLLLHK